LIVFEVEDFQRLESVESLVLYDLDVGVVEMKNGQMFHSYESMAREDLDAVSIYKHVGGVHGEVGWDGAKVRDGAVYHIGGPGVVVIAAAAVGTSHLAVAGIELAALAERKAMALVGTEEFLGVCLDKRKD